MHKYSYDSEVVKTIFSKDSVDYDIDDWKFLAEFHRHYHEQWIEIALSLAKDNQLHKLSFYKLYKHFIKRFWGLPSRKKIKGLLNLTRGRPTKKQEYERIRKLIIPLKKKGMTDAKAMEYLISINVIPEMDSRTFSRIKNSK